MMKKFMKKLWEKKDSKKGFTLVELIVVLVILAILAAIMVPALIGWIDKAKEQQASVNARTVYLAAQTISSEKYGKATSAAPYATAMGLDAKKQLTVTDASSSGTEGEIAALAAVTDEYSAVIQFDDGKVTGITYTPKDTNIKPVTIGQTPTT